MIIRINDYGNDDVGEGGGNKKRIRSINNQNQILHMLCVDASMEKADVRLKTDNFFYSTWPNRLNRAERKMKQKARTRSYIKLNSSSSTSSLLMSSPSLSSPNSYQ